VNTYVFYIESDVDDDLGGRHGISSTQSGDIIRARDRAEFLEMFCGLEETTPGLIREQDWSSWVVIEIHKDEIPKVFRISDLV
jgi:hypothetical protein